MRLTQRTLVQPNSPIGAHARLLDQVPVDKSLLDLSQGAPGFPPAAVVTEAMVSALRNEDGSRYSPLKGLPALREAYATDLSAMYGADLSSEDVCVTSGCNQAFTMVVSALAEAGDEVIVPLPYYFNHEMWLGLDGLVSVHAKPADGLRLSVADVSELVTNRTRALLLVTPGNPTGSIMTSAELSAFADFARDAGIVLVLDETYRSFVPGALAGEAPHDLFGRPDWRDYLVSLHSCSKDLAIPGQRIGAIVGESRLLDEVAKLIDCVTICAPRSGQMAAIAGLTKAQDWRIEKVREIAEKQARFEAVMAAEPGGFRLHSSGAYYGWVQHPFDDRSSDGVVEQLILEQGILVIPGTAFMPADERMLRFSFANAPLSRLAELSDRLVEFSSNVR